MTKVLVSKRFLAGNRRSYRDQDTLNSAHDAYAFDRLMVTKETDPKDMEKLEKVEKKWAGMHVNKLAHLGCQSTNRVEGGHATLKSILTNAGGNLQKAYESVHKWYTGMVRNRANQFSGH
jgi:hypothetical protein